MSPAKVTLQQRRRKGIPLLSAAGLSLSLSGGAPAAMGVATADIPKCLVGMNHEQTLGEEEITDITLSTFDISEGASVPWLRTRIAGGGACGGCGSGLYSNPPAYNGPVSGPSPPARKPTHQTLKRPQAPHDRNQRASRAGSPEAGALAPNRNATNRPSPKWTA